MEDLSAFEMSNYENVEKALRTVRDSQGFLRADQAFSAKGPVVRFAWPDWPEELSQRLKKAVNELHRKTPLLRRIPADTEEWNSVFQGWQSDAESAKAIGEAFSACFPGRVQWVFSRRDRRGRVGATCSVQGLGNVSIDLTWKSCFAAPTGSVSAADRATLSDAVERVSKWAGRRINTILEELRSRLAALYGERFRGLYVFGSYARPDAGIELPESSDLDVALIVSDFDDLYEERDRFGDIVSDLSLEHDLVIYVAPIREADYIAGTTNFTRVISEYAIPVK